MNLHLQPITLKGASAYIAEHHRHHPPTVGHRFSVSVADGDGVIRGVGVAGRPVSRVLDSEGFLEVLRVATDGTPNVCSMLYGALRRAGIALGYPPRKIITYTLSTESGASLRASGWVEDGMTTGGGWSRASRPRTTTAPTIPKTRWVAAGGQDRRAGAEGGAQ